MVEVKRIRAIHICGDSRAFTLPNGPTQAHVLLGPTTNVSASNNLMYCRQDARMGPENTYLFVKKPPHPPPVFRSLQSLPNMFSSIRSHHTLTRIFLIYFFLGSSFTQPSAEKADSDSPSIVSDTESDLIECSPLYGTDLLIGPCLNAIKKIYPGILVRPVTVTRDKKSRFTANLQVPAVYYDNDGERCFS